MPTYDYKCENCNKLFTAIHSIKEKCNVCNYCNSSNVHKTISLFAAKTENSLEHSFRKHQDQFKKDMERFQKDDNFAANITGYDDPNSAARMEKILKEQQQKQLQSLKQFKGKKNE